MKTSISYGYYGPRKIYKFHGRPFLMRVNLPDRKELHLIISENRTFPIFSQAKYPTVREIDKFNTESINSNSKLFNEISQIKRNGKNIYLYVVTDLSKTGGVERRLSLLFSWLEKKGIQPVIVCEENNYKPFAHIPTIKIKFETPNIDTIILEIVERTQASILEFQLKCPRLLHSVNIDSLKQKTKVGCMIHGIVDGDQSIFDKLDYRATSTQHANNYHGFTTIPNVVEFPNHCPDFHLESKKALYIGRIDNEKLPTIINFVKLCKQNNVEFMIAGPISRQKQTNALISKLPVDTCIGPINTRSFLTEQGSNFLFIGGVGQVPLEAAAANIPSLVTPHSSDLNRSTFLTAENLSSIRDWNCVIKDDKIPKEIAPGNSSDFFNSLQEARKSKSLTPIQKFRIRSTLEEQLSEDVVWGKYLELVNSLSTS